MAIRLPFSKRSAAVPSQFRYDVPEKARRRIFISLEQDCRQQFSPTCDLDTILSELGDKLMAAYGGLSRSGYEAANVSDHPVINHFMLCDNSMALDWIEYVFECFHYRGGDRWRQVVNEIFKQEGIGYELTPFVETIVKGDKPLTGAALYTGAAGYGDRVEYQYPQIIKKDDEYMHAEVVQPCLSLLSDPKFKNANEEMLKAHKEYRDGNYADAITDCGSAFETVMKTICEAKGWPYDKGKATCKDLVAVCKEKGLFPSFYVSYFEGAGTIRNKLGDAHGKGPKPEFTATKEHFEHLVQITSANILFLARTAKI